MGLEDGICSRINQIMKMVYRIYIKIGTAYYTIISSIVDKRFFLNNLSIGF